MEHEEQKIFVERYEVHQEEERQIYLVNVEGNFINKDVNRMQQDNRQIMQILVTFKCIYLGRQKSTLQLFDNHARTYTLLFDKDCYDINMHSPPTSILYYLFRLSLAFFLLLFLYILLRKCSKRNLFLLSFRQPI